MLSYAKPTSIGQQHFRVFFRLVTLIFVLIFIFPAKLLLAQKPASTNQSGYIAKVDTIISIKLNANTEFEQFEVNGDNFYYDIRPNITLSNKLAFSYRFISFGIGFKPKFIPGNNDNDMQGKTQTLSFGLNIITSHWMQELGFAYVSGFYLRNTSDFDPTWIKGTNPYIQFPDLKVASLRGSTGYKFNRNFSLKSLSSKTEIQLKSCGSLITSLIYDYFETNNQSADTAQHTSQQSSNFNAIATLGYMYTFVIHSRFYASLGITPGMGFNFTKLLTRLPGDNITTNYSDPLFRMQEKAAIGYNSTKFYAGVELSLSQAVHTQNNTTVQTKATRTYLQAFVGYRFNAPRFLKHETDVVKGIAPATIQKILE